MKLTQVLATGLSTLGLFASTTQGSVLPYESASAKLIVENVQDITNRSADLQKVVSSITPSTLFQSGKDTVVGLQGIVKDLTDELKNWKPSTDVVCVKGAPFTDPADAKPICAGFRAFVEVHQMLLALIIGKRSVFSNTPLLAEMAAVLREIEAIVDSVAFFLIDAVPPCSQGVQEDQGKIDISLGEATKKYSVPFGEATQKHSVPLVMTTWVQVLKEYL